MNRNGLESDLAGEKKGEHLADDLSHPVETRGDHDHADVDELANRQREQRLSHSDSGWQPRCEKSYQPARALPAHHQYTDSHANAYPKTPQERQEPDAKVDMVRKQREPHDRQRVARRAQVIIGAPPENQSRCQRHGGGERDSSHRQKWPMPALPRRAADNRDASTEESRSQKYVDDDLDDARSEMKDVRRQVLLNVRLAIERIRRSQLQWPAPNAFENDFPVPAQNEQEQRKRQRNRGCYPEGRNDLSCRRQFSCKIAKDE